MPTMLSAVMIGAQPALWIRVGQRVAEIPSDGRIPRNREHHLEATHPSRRAAVGSPLSFIQKTHHAALHVVRRRGWDANFVVRQPFPIRIHEAGGGGREVPVPNEPPAHLWQRVQQGLGRGLLLYPRKRRPWQSSCACSPLACSHAASQHVRRASVKWVPCWRGWSGRHDWVPLTRRLRLVIAGRSPTFHPPIEVGAADEAGCIFHDVASIEALKIALRDTPAIFATWAE